MIESKDVPKPIGAYSQAISAGDFVFVSGQLAFDFTGKLVRAPIKDQTKMVLSNIEKILAAADLGISNIVKVEVYLKDINDFKEFNEIYSKWVLEPFPCRQSMQVANLPLGALVEVSCIAYRGNS
ncbi:MAG TPA: Rid family detoxifying hydrolase [archaeon]|nr:Rid family detoxifying hydrolase [archaeon]